MRDNIRIQEPISAGSPSNLKKRFPWLAVILYFVIVSASVSLTFPFLKNSEQSVTQLNFRLQGIIFSFFAMLLIHAWLIGKIRNMFILFFVSFVISCGIEFLGVSKGESVNILYRYNEAITPSLFGVLPICIPLGWFGLSYTALIFYRPMKIWSGNKLSIPGLILKSVVCALYITAFDFVLDPIAVHYGFWSWSGTAEFFGVPYANFFCWLLIGFIICFLTLILQGSGEDKNVSGTTFFELMTLFISVLLTISSFIICMVTLKTVKPVLISLTFMLPVWIYWAITGRKFMKSKRHQDQLNPG